MGATCTKANSVSTLSTGVAESASEGASNKVRHSDSIVAPVASQLAQLAGRRSSAVSTAFGSTTTGVNASGFLASCEIHGDLVEDVETLDECDCRDLAQLQAALRTCAEGHVLDLQGATIRDPEHDYEGHSLLIEKRVTIMNGTIVLPPNCPVEVCSQGSTVILADCEIRAPISKGSILVIRKGASLHMQGCTVQGGQKDAIQVRGVGSELKAVHCKINSMGDGAGLCVMLGATAALKDCSLLGLIGIEVLDPGSKLAAQQCTVDGSDGGVRTGLLVDGGASAELLGCTLNLAQVNGVRVLGKESSLTAKSCSINRCISTNVEVQGGANVVLDSCSCSDSRRGCGVDAHGIGSRAHIVNLNACSNNEHNISLSGGVHAELFGCTLDSAGSYGVKVEDRGTSALLIGCMISNGGLQNVVVAGGGMAVLQKCRTFGGRLGFGANDPRLKWGWASYGANSTLEAVDCYWSPKAPPKMLFGASRHQRKAGLPPWLQ